jgi:hypothetical protein
MSPSTNTFSPFGKEIQKNTGNSGFPTKDFGS